MQLSVDNPTAAAANAAENTVISGHCCISVYFLLVPAHLGCPRQNSMSRKTVVFVCVCFHWQQHPFNGPLSGTSRVSRYQKGKTSLDLLEQETVNGTGISWALCKSALHPDQYATSEIVKRRWSWVCSCKRRYSKFTTFTLFLPCQHPPLSFFIGQMLFLPPNQQCQSTEELFLFDSRCPGYRDVLLTCVLQNVSAVCCICWFFFKLCASISQSINQLWNYAVYSTCTVCKNIVHSLASSFLNQLLDSWRKWHWFLYADCLVTN